MGRGEAARQHLKSKGREIFPPFFEKEDQHENG